MIKMAKVIQLKVRLTVLCRSCSQPTEMMVNKKDFKSWENGTLIQTAFPYLAAAERELLISRTCGSCWAKMFSLDEGGASV